MRTRLTWDAAILAGAAAIALLAGSIDLPWSVDAREATTAGSRPPEGERSDVLVLLPDAPAGRAQSFDDLDCTFGWYNSLWHHFGSFSTALTRNLSPDLLDGRRIVVVPDRVTDAMPDNGIRALADFADSGGQVVLEQPGPAWSDLTGTRPTGEPRPAERISSVTGLGPSGRLRERLPETPLAGDLLPVPASPPWPEGRSLLDVGDHPGLLVREKGDGAVYTVLFAFGCTVTALQQGRPEPAGSFETTRRAELEPTASRAVDERMHRATAPYADLLERAVLGRVRADRPTPRLWPHPAGRAGTVMTVHSAARSPRAAFAFVDHAERHDAPTTVLPAADRWSAELQALARRAGADVGLLWIRGRTRTKSTRTTAIAGMPLIERERTLAGQLDLLARRSGGFDQRRVVQIEGASQTEGWARSARQLAGAGAAVDVSYGPQGPDQFGYLFGTGYPFYPLDRRGLPVPVLELPFVLHPESLTPDRLEAFLRRSADGHHQSLAISVPGEAMRRSPDPDLMLALSDLYRRARRHRHWLASVPTFARFLSARFQSRVDSEWRPAQGVLAATVEIPERPPIGGADGQRIGLALPVRTSDRQLDRIEVDGERRQVEELQHSGDGSESIVALGPGTHRVKAHYRPD